MPKEITTEILIAAPPARVWLVLIDFAAYGSWNPFIRAASGAVGVGAVLDITVQPPGGRAMRFHPTVLLVEPDRTLSWRGRFLLPGLFDGEHRFSIDATAGGSHFTQSERFSGLLVPLAGRGLLAATRAGFEAMNQALKARAEAAG